MINGEVNAPTREISLPQKLWILANYLLVKNDCTYMYMEGYSPNVGQDYGRLILFPEYKIKIGHAISDMFKTQGVWERNYSGGLVIVNPYDHAAKVELPQGDWKNVNHHRVRDVIRLPRNSGQILLNTPGRNPLGGLMDPD